jgi:putative CocE/NonD family hydrolase
MAAGRGFTVVVQDTRGRWASDGDGYPFVHEQHDGYDTVVWCTEQQWSTGRVGMYGASYVGYTQYAAARPVWSPSSPPSPSLSPMTSCGMAGRSASARW